MSATVATRSQTRHPPAAAESWVRLDTLANQVVFRLIPSLGKTRR